MNPKKKILENYASMKLDVPTAWTCVDLKYNDLCKFKAHVFKKCCGSLHIFFSGYMYQSDERVVHVFSTEQR